MKQKRDWYRKESTNWKVGTLKYSLNSKTNLVFI